VTISRRDLLLGSGVILAQLALSQPAGATTARALTLPQLRKRAKRVVLGRPALHESEWADVGGTRRIITRTRFLQESDWLRGGGPDEPLEDEFTVWRLGGRVGEILQKVPGEAQLPLNELVLLFVEDSVQDTKRIVGMSQGSYPVVEQQHARQLMRSTHLPHLMGGHTGPDVPELERPAVDVLHQRPISAAFSLVRSLP